MFQNLNPLDKSTALLEILIMLLVAFILGWLFSKCCQCCKKSCEDNACDTAPDAPEAPAAKKPAAKPIAEKPAAKREDFAASLSVGAAKSGAKDDLKKINGIGPVIEKKLNKLGIKTYEQVANVTKADTLKIDEAIEFFPGRIHRDNWKTQARKLIK